MNFQLTMMIYEYINYKYGRNCHISYITYDKKFNLIMAPNTLHFNIYNKDYSNSH